MNLPKRYSWFYIRYSNYKKLEKKNKSSNLLTLLSWRETMGQWERIQSYPLGIYAITRPADPAPPTARFVIKDFLPARSSCAADLHVKNEFREAHHPLEKTVRDWNIWAPNYGQFFWFYTCDIRVRRIFLFVFPPAQRRPWKRVHFRFRYTLGFTFLFSSIRDGKRELRLIQVVCSINLLIRSDGLGLLFLLGRSYPRALLAFLILHNLYLALK